jgi:glycosyltransferase involved in cell wall biosynthesis
MVKVIFYTDTPIYGGAERHMTLLARNLDKEKYQVTIVFSAYKELNNWHEELNTAGINVIRLKVFHKHDPKHLFILKKLLAKEKPDILHIHIWNPASCRYAFFAANTKITKIVATEHDPFSLKGIKKSIMVRSCCCAKQSRKLL